MNHGNVRFPALVKFITSYVWLGFKLSNREFVVLLICTISHFFLFFHHFFFLIILRCDHLLLLRCVPHFDHFHNLILLSAPGSPVWEYLLNTMGSSWSTGSTATQFWICWGRSGPSSESGRDHTSPPRLSGCCCKNGMWVVLNPIRHLWKNNSSYWEWF